MKTFSLLRPLSWLIAGGWLSCLPMGFAAPGTIGTAAGTTTGNAGHAFSAASASAGHSAHVSAGSSARPAMNVSGGFRSPAGVGNGAGINRSRGGLAPTNNTVTGPRGAAPQMGPTRPLVQLPSVRNAWTDPANPRVAGGYTYAGNHLYPGAYGYSPTRPASGHFQHGPDGDNGDRRHHRYYYNNFPYAIYYPYPYNNYGYGGVGTYGYAGLGGYSGITTDNNVADFGAPDFSNAPNNYYSYVEPDQTAPSASAPAAQAQPLPDAPAVGPQIPSSTDKSAGVPPGPDSLVEAVQNELSQRGYFAGKADAMCGPDTREAIRRFQTDQRLPATERINEATLHALHLD